MGKLRIRIDDTVQSRVEQLAADAKRYTGAGDEHRALECYRQAADMMLGAPWLQHRTAELARKLELVEVAVLHYRRAAAAFIAAGFPKRALSPLRNAWNLSFAQLPVEANAFVTLTLELAHVQRDLGLRPEAIDVVATANQALQTCGCADRVPWTLEASESGSSDLQRRPVSEVVPRSLSTLAPRDA